MLCSMLSHKVEMHVPVSLGRHQAVQCSDAFPLDTQIKGM